MLALADLKAGQSLVGLEPDLVATVVAVVPIADTAVQIIYKTPDGTLKDRLLNKPDEATISLATTERPWAFDGDGAAFQLTCEAKRIDRAQPRDRPGGEVEIIRAGSGAPVVRLSIQERSLQGHC